MCGRSRCLQLMTYSIIVPGSLVVSQKNVLAFSYHFKLYEQVSVDDNFAIFAVYASNPYTRACLVFL